MDTKMMIEIAGYIGSALVVVSMLMSSVVKLRVINTVGSTISAIYALIIHSYPLALMNICLIIINIYNLTKLLKSTQQYNLVRINTDDVFLDYLLNYYKDDIKSFFPDMSANIPSADTAYIVCCNSDPAGVFLGKAEEADGINICLDYATPTYRDCSVGRFLYPELAKGGIRKMIYSGKSESHEPYLKKMGFVSENGVYVKHLS